MKKLKTDFTLSTLETKSAHLCGLGLEEPLRPSSCAFLTRPESLEVSSSKSSWGRPCSTNFPSSNTKIRSNSSTKCSRCMIQNTVTH